MTARELIEQEYRNLEECAECSKEHCGHRCYHEAAERVIERLWKDCATLSANYEAAERRAKAAEQHDPDECKECDRWQHDSARERYRARLDAMVAALVPRGLTPEIMKSMVDGLVTYTHTVERAKQYLAAIDAEVEKR